MLSPEGVDKDPAQRWTNVDVMIGDNGGKRMM